MCSLVAGIQIAAWSQKSTQPSPTRLTFEVASIRPTKAGSTGGGIKPLPGGQEYVAKNVPVKLMIRLLYRVPMRQIVGGPAWLETDPYDVDAKADRSYNIDDLHVMFQNLLADEFKLRFHKEIKKGPVYALVADKSGLKMKINHSAQDFNVPIAGGTDGVAIGTRVPMSYLTWWLEGVLQADGRPVIDQTGLTDFYDFRLSFTFPRSLNATDESSSIDAAKPSIFDALRQQLGLRLQPETGPVEYYVIDNIEKPTATAIIPNANSGIHE